MPSRPGASEVRPSAFRLAELGTGVVDPPDPPDPPGPSSSGSSRLGATDTRLGTFLLGESGIFTPGGPTLITIPISPGSKDGHITAESSPRVWPPVGAPLANTDSDTSYAVFMRNVWHPTFNFTELANGALIFDTSIIPDDAVITDVKLRACVGDIDAAGGLANNLELEYYNFGAGIDAADWAASVSPTAGVVPFATWSAWALEAIVDIPLLNPDTNINKSGETGIRIAFASSALSGASILNNIVTFYSLENATFPEAQLLVSYTLGETQYGDLSMPIDFLSSVDGQVTSPSLLYGQVDLPITFGASVDGQVISGTQYGSVTMPIQLTIDVRLTTAATILNNADAIYLGSTPVEAVYAEGQQVWP